MSKIYQSSRLRLNRNSLVEHAYHLRFSVDKNVTLSLKFSEARAVVRAVARAQEMGRASTYCYCVMPDHVHWLMILKKGSISQSIQNIKSLSKHLSDSPIFWQQGYFDHGIQDQRALRETARYIVANPLRAGLVDTIGGYPHWDAVWLK